MQLSDLIVEITNSGAKITLEKHVNGPVEGIFQIKISSEDHHSIILTDTDTYKSATVDVLAEDMRQCFQVLKQKGK